MTLFLDTEGVYLIMNLDISSLHYIIIKFVIIKRLNFNMACVSYKSIYGGSI